MPKYIYKCTACDVVLGLYHAMSDTANDCTQCGTADSLIKKPSFFNLEQDKQQERKVGAVVKESIQDFKEELEAQKQEIQGQLYKEDE